MADTQENAAIPSDDVVMTDADQPEPGSGAVASEVKDEVMEDVDSIKPDDVKPAGGITSQDLSIMRGIVDQLTEYKDEK